MADGDSHRVGALLEVCNGALRGGARQGILLVGDSLDECRWCVERILSEIAEDERKVFTVSPLDPFVCVGRLLDPEDAQGILNARCQLCIVHGLNWLMPNQLNPLTALLLAVAASRGIRVVLSTERTPGREVVTEPTGPLVVDLGTLPCGESRRELVELLVKQAFNRTSDIGRVLSDEADQFAAVDRLAQIDLPGGRLQLEAIIDSSVRRFSRGTEAFATCVSGEGSGPETKVDRAALLTKADIRSRLHEIVEGIERLDRLCIVVRQTTMFANCRLPSISLKGTPEHWFGELVARFYAVVFDAGGSRLRFVDLLEPVGGREELTRANRSQKNFPKLVEAVRTWRYHGVDYSSSRTAAQIAVAANWFGREVGSRSPEPEHWRVLCGALLKEAGAYIQQLETVLKRLEKNPHLISAWLEFETQRAGRPMFQAAAKVAITNLAGKIPVDPDRFVNRHLSKWRSQLDALDVSSDLTGIIQGLVEHSLLDTLSDYCPVAAQDIISHLRIDGSVVVRHLLRNAQDLYRSNPRLSKDEILAVTKATYLSGLGES